MKIRLKPINEQVVVVVGASSGIGRDTALEFARLGAKVVVAARSEAGLQSLASEITARGGQALVVRADVADFEQVEKIADQAVEHFGRIDTWVHLAGVAIYAPFEKTTPAEFKRLIEVNLLGQVYGAQVALPYLRKNGGGSLIHIGSIESKRALPFHSAYSASKHGMLGFLDALRLELQKEGAPINVTAILPASINTPLFNKALTKLGVKPMPVPPIYEPRVVTDMIIYAAEHPARELIAGGAGKLLIASHLLSPTLTDTFLKWVAFRGQQTNEPVSVGSPHNLYSPVAGFDRVRGDFGKLATPRSFSNWLNKHALTRKTLWLVTTGLGLRRLLRSQPRS